MNCGIANEIFINLQFRLVSTSFFGYANMHRTDQQIRTITLNVEAIKKNEKSDLYLC